MGLLDLPYSDIPEQIDDASQPEAVVALSMADLISVNRFFGGAASTLGPLGAIVREIPTGATVRVLDVGTGSGDIPRAVVALLASEGRPARVVATDINPRMLRMASDGKPDAIHLVRADALALPFVDGAFDVALCSMTLHHLGFDASTTVLRALDRVTTRGFIVTDLLRDRLSLAMVGAGLRLMRARPMTLHDADASVRRAFTLREAEKLIGASGVQNARIDTTWHYRLRIVQMKPAPRHPEPGTIEPVLI